MPDTGLDEGIEMKAEVFLPEDYQPAEDEPFMNERQLEYFRRKLIKWRLELLEGSRETIKACRMAPAPFPTWPTAQARKPTAHLSCGPVTVSASWSPRSTPHCAGSTKANTVIVKRPASPSASSGWMRARSPR